MSDSAKVDRAYDTFRARALRGLDPLKLFGHRSAEPGPTPEPVYQSIYPTGFPTQWGNMSGPMTPMQNVSGWQLNPAQIDALFAMGNAQGSSAGLPAQGSYLARLAALQGGRSGA